MVLTLAKANRWVRLTRAVQKWLLRGQKKGTEVATTQGATSEICSRSVTRRLKMKRLVTCSSCGLRCNTSPSTMLPTNEAVRKMRSTLERMMPWARLMGILDRGMHAWLLLLSRVLLVQVVVMAMAGGCETGCRLWAGISGRRRGARTALTAYAGDERNTWPGLVTLPWRGGCSRPGRGAAGPSPGPPLPPAYPYAPPPPRAGPSPRPGGFPESFSHSLCLSASLGVSEFLPPVPPQPRSACARSLRISHTVSGFRSFGLSSYLPLQRSLPLAHARALCSCLFTFADLSLSLRCLSLAHFFCISWGCVYVSHRFSLTPVSHSVVCLFLSLLLARARCWSVSLSFSSLFPFSVTPVSPPTLGQFVCLPVSSLCLLR